MNSTKRLYENMKYYYSVNKIIIIAIKAAIIITIDYFNNNKLANILVIENNTRYNIRCRFNTSLHNKIKTGDYLVFYQDENIFFLKRKNFEKLYIKRETRKTN